MLDLLKVINKNALYILVLSVKVLVFTLAIRLLPQISPALSSQMTAPQCSLDMVHKVRAWSARTRNNSIMDGCTQTKKNTDGRLRTVPVTEGPAEFNLWMSRRGRRSEWHALPCLLSASPLRHKEYTRKEMRICKPNGHGSQTGNGIALLRNI